jgi:hypothetical protein
VNDFGDGGRKLSKLDMLKDRFPGCGANPANRRCRYHVRTPLVGRCFTTKQALLDYVAPGTYAGDMVREDIDGVAYAILRASLDAHDWRGEFPIEPPERFMKEQREFNGARHHGWLPTWADGATFPDWSYRKGFESNPQRARFNAAARNEVAAQILEIRHGCGIEGAHVHHAAPGHFKRLLHDWLAQNDLAVDGVPLREYGVVYYFAKPEHAAGWQAFHAANAVLIALSPADHARAHRNEAAGLRWDGAPMEHAA